MAINKRQYLYPHERRMLLAVLTLGACLFVLNQYFQSVILIDNLECAIEEDDDNSLSAYINSSDFPDINVKKTTNSTTIKATIENKNSGKHVNSKKEYPTQDQNISINEAFDPNSSSASSLIEMGIPKVVSRNIAKYLEAGGRFYTTDDIKKIYGMDSSLFSKLEPYLQIEENENTKVSASSLRKTRISIDLNSSTAEELMQIKGIGPSFSNRIIKYREILGFFDNVQQLKEIYGIDEEKYLQIKDQVFCGVAMPGLNINQLEAYELGKHPYLDYKTAKIIIAYRNQHGLYSELDDLRKIVIINDSTLNRIKPYLNFTQK